MLATVSDDPTLSHAATKTPSASIATAGRYGDLTVAVAIAPERDLLAVRTEGWLCIVVRIAGEAGLIGAVGVHHVDVGRHVASAPVGTERDLEAEHALAGLLVICGVRREVPEIGSWQPPHQFKHVTTPAAPILRKDMAIAPRCKRRPA